MDRIGALSRTRAYVGDNAVPMTENEEYVCGCSWAIEGIPVDGWVAVESFWSNGTHYSWRVVECPKFTADEEVTRRRGI